MRELDERPAAGTLLVAPARSEYVERSARAWHLCECGRTCTAAVRVASVPRVRSGLAHAAGFAGLAVLFRPSLATLLLTHLGVQSAAVLSIFVLTGVVAPLAVALSFAAGASLDRAPEKSGRPQALFGFFVGLLGTVGWLAEVSHLRTAFGW